MRFQGVSFGTLYSPNFKGSGKANSRALYLSTQNTNNIPVYILLSQSQRSQKQKFPPPPSSKQPTPLHAPVIPSIFLFLYGKYIESNILTTMTLVSVIMQMLGVFVNTENLTCRNCQSLAKALILSSQPLIFHVIERNHKLGFMLRSSDLNRSYLFDKQSNQSIIPFLLQPNFMELYRYTHVTVHSSLVTERKSEGKLKGSRKVNQRKDNVHFQVHGMITYPVHGGPSLESEHFTLPLRSQTLLYREEFYI